MPDMPKFEKSPPELVARFGATLDAIGADAVGASPVTRRPMFGYPCAWVNGNMATGLFARTWWVRLAPERLTATLASGEGRPFEVMPGRGMKGYVAMSDEILADDAALAAWIREALDYTATLPPKSK